MDTHNTLIEQIEALDQDTLTPIVQRATSCSGPLTQWQATPIHVSMGGFSPSLLYRFSGGIQHAAHKQAWSLILKVTSPGLQGKGQMSSDLGDFSREYEFYRSGIWQAFPPGFRAAQCFAQHETVGPAGQPAYWLWLEDMGAPKPVPWSLEENYRAAWGLGKLNGMYLSSQTLPQALWMNKDMIRQYLRMTEPAFERLFRLRELPIIRTIFPPDLMDSLVQMWQKREQHLAVLERLPQTLCHGDAQFTNLFLVATPTEDVETVAIDWSAVGTASVGVDLAQFFMLSLFFTDPTQIQAVEGVLFEGYLAGIQAVGWQGDPRLVRLGFTAAMLRTRATNVLRIMEVISDEGQARDRLLKTLHDRQQSLEAWSESVALIQPTIRRLFEESQDLRAALSMDKTNGFL